MNRQVRIYHAIQLFAGLGAPLTLPGMLAGLKAYQTRLVAGFMEDWQEEPSSHEPGTLAAFLLPLADIAWLCAELCRLANKHVAPVLAV